MKGLPNGVSHENEKKGNKRPPTDFRLVSQLFVIVQKSKAKESDIHAYVFQLTNSVFSNLVVLYVSLPADCSSLADVLFSATIYFFPC